MTLNHLQLLQNAAARLLTGAQKWDHIYPLLSWFPDQYRIDFKLLVFVYTSLNGLDPSYLSELLLVHKPAWSLRSSDHSSLIVQRTKYKRRGIGLLRWQLQKDGTVFPPTLELLLL